MATLPLRRSTIASAVLVARRVYRITPPANCTINIGPTAVVAHDHRYAQLRAGVTYEFATNNVDTTLTGLARRIQADATPEPLDYINHRAG